MLKERLDYLNQILKAILFVCLILLVREWTNGIHLNTYQDVNERNIYVQSIGDPSSSSPYQTGA